MKSFDDSQQAARPIRAIVIGVGLRTHIYLRELKDNLQFEVVAAVDTSPANLETVVREFDIPANRCFANLHEALEAVSADATFVITPAQFHGEYIERSLNAGLHVMVEKPFTVCFAEARRLVATAEERGLKIMVTQTMRYIPINYTTARLVREQTYGPPSYFNWIFHKHRPTPYPDSPHQQMFQMSIHDLDTLRSIFSVPVKKVHCREITPNWSRYTTPPTVLAMLEFEQDISGVYLGSSDSKNNAMDVRVECAEGAIVQRGYRGQLTFQSAKSEILLDNDPLPEVANEDAMMLRLFYNYVIHNQEPDISGRNNLETMRLIDACIRSSDTGEIIDLSQE